MNEHTRCILAICRESKDLELITKCEPDGRLVVATDDPEVEERADAEPRVVRVVPLEGARSITSVWDRTVRTTQQVNGYLLAQQKQYYPALTKWFASPDCPDTTGRIADTLLLIDAFEQLFESDIDRVMLVRRVATRWEDEVLVAVAERCCKEIVQLERPAHRLTKWYWPSRTAWRWRNHEFAVYLPLALHMFCRRIRFVWDLVTSALTYPFVRRHDKARNVLLLLSDSGPNRLENSILIQEEFERRPGWDPVTVCWRANDAYRAFRNLDLSVAKLESWMQITKLAQVTREYRLARMLVMQAFSRYEGDELSYKEIDLVPLLAPFIRRYAQYELLERLALFQALTHFLEINNIHIVKTWQAGVSPLGAICHFVLSEIEIRSGQKRPFIFDNDLAPRTLFLPVPSEEACDLILVPGAHERQMTGKRDGAADNMIVTGFSLSGEIRQFADQVRRDDSTSLLGAKRSETCNIFVSSPPIRRGYYSRYQHNHVIEHMVRFACDHPDVTIIAQPQTDDELVQWKRGRERHGMPANLFLVEGEISPYHCLNFCDLVLTQVNTLAFAAMEIGKPVVAVALDGDKRTLETYGDAVLKFTDLNDLDAFFKYILDSRHNLSTWRDAAVSKQNEFLPMKLNQPGTNVESYMVDRVLDLLGHEMTLLKTIRRKPAKRSSTARRAAALARMQKQAVRATQQAG